jgi:hypothetical protein
MKEGMPTIKSVKLICILSCNYFNALSVACVRRRAMEGRKFPICLKVSNPFKCRQIQIRRITAETQEDNRESARR